MPPSTRATAAARTHGNKVIGVAFQGLNNATTRVCDSHPVIRHFLEDIKDGVYDGYVDMGIQAAPILNPAMRQGIRGCG